MVIFVSDTDTNALIAFDMFQEPTDQMSSVEIEVCAPMPHADEVAAILRTIRSSAEVASALLDGNLGIRETLLTERFPRYLMVHGEKLRQDAQFFCRGKVVHATGPT
jgi:hypothetical protein